MDTSPAMRLVMLALLFVGSFAVIFANIRNIVRLILKKPVSRRSIGIWGVLGLLMVLSAVDAFLIEPDWLRVTHHTIETDKLPQGARLRIVQLTDLHVKELGPREERAIHLTASEQPDIIVLTGDYRAVHGNDDRLSDVLEEIGRRLSKIAPTYAIEGNWDYPPQLMALERGGVTWLRDWTTIPCEGGKGIALGSGLNALISGDRQCPEDIGESFKLMLFHAPQHFVASGIDWADLVLTGHTHGGQVRLPVFGALAPLRQLVDIHQMGMYEHANAQLYVNAGVGMEGLAPELRFWCRPEVAVFEIVGKKQ